MGKSPGAPGPTPSQPPTDSSSPWTWITALLVLGLVLASFGFAYALIALGIDPRLATVITLLIVIGIVIRVMPSKSGDTIGRRLVRALIAFGRDDQK